ncbi:MAG: aminotransferase class V-fold PLP-dependent enzyme [Alphaproteobacteria bacterium]|nr:aminotransferase class V-fold PLP-dependent enzyme [Alphaproteobacteria bacterium]
MLVSQNPVFIPGPTNMPEHIRKACDMATIDHRSPIFGKILQPAREGVKKIIKSNNAEIFIFSGTGTAGWETAITNSLSAGDAVIITRNGMFSHRWIDMCQRHGIIVHVIEAIWGDPISATKIGDLLEADNDNKIKAVLATHNETATGVKSDIGAIRGAMDSAKHDALLLVDGVSSVASFDFRFDEWRVDILVAGSQKGFMMPPGLAIVGFSEKAMQANESATLPRTYFDIRDMHKSYASNMYPYTPPVGLMNGLHVACNTLLEEGLDNVFARHHRIAEGVRTAVKAWGLPICANSPDCYSNTITAIRTPEGFDSTQIINHAAQKYQVAFGIGLGDVAGKVFRIGHLGMLTDVLALSGIATAEMVMVDLGLDVTLGSGVAAAQDYYRNNSGLL